MIAYHDEIFHSNISNKREKKSVDIVGNFHESRQDTCFKERNLCDIFFLVLLLFGEIRKLRCTDVCGKFLKSF